MAKCAVHFNTVTAFSSHFFSAFRCCLLPTIFLALAIFSFVLSLFRAGYMPFLFSGKWFFQLNWFGCSGISLFFTASFKAWQHVRISVLLSMKWLEAGRLMQYRHQLYGHDHSLFPSEMIQIAFILSASVTMTPLKPISWRRRPVITFWKCSWNQESDPSSLLL